MKKARKSELRDQDKSACFQKQVERNGRVLIAARKFSVLLKIPGHCGNLVSPTLVSSNFFVEASDFTFTATSDELSGVIFDDFECHDETSM